MRLVLEHVGKQYPGGARALRDVSLEAGPGMFGLLGANGAGKSTLLRVVATLLAPDEGRVTFGAIDARRDPQALRESLGYLPQEFGFHPAVPVDQTLAHYAALKGLGDRAARDAAVDALLARTNLLAVRRRPAGTLSGGMRQRLGLAVALAGNPRLLVLDEPTAGLDPAERHRLYDLLAELADDRVVLLSTHLVDDVHELCTDMAILHQGAVAARGRPAELVAGLAGHVWQGPDPGGASPPGARLISRRRLGGSRVARWWSAAPLAAPLARVEPSLEDVFFLLAGPDA